MYKKFRKIAAAALAASLLFSTASMASVEETQPVAMTEETQMMTETQAPAEKATEKVTEAPTEKVTEAPTEKVTEAPTEKATEAPTEKVTEAPTEKVTEAPTEKATEAPTEKVTEAPTEKTTETQAVSETDESEKKDSEKKKPKDKKRSKRKNDGEKLNASGITAGLGSALDYLFAGQTVEGAQEIFEDQRIAEGDEGASIVSSLKGFSKKLANAQSTSDVEVINVYADKNGKLDEAQLTEKFKDRRLDVQKKYYVVNVIAYSADQNLTFSGYELVRGGASVVYEEGSEPGDVLYNFAALEDGKFVGYRGTATLTGGALLGTYLAPEAKVEVNNNLSGAVYADSIKVAEGVDELLHIAFATMRTPDGTEAQTEEVTETATEAQTEEATEATTEIQTEEATETATEARTEEATETATEAQTEEATEAATEAKTEEAIEAATEARTEEETEAATETRTEEVTEATTEIQTEEATEAATEVQTEEMTEAATEAQTEVIDESSETPEYFSKDAVYYSAKSANLKLKLADAKNAALTGGKIAIKAAADILNKDNTIYVKKDTEIVSAMDAYVNAADVGRYLQRNGSYYMEISSLPSGYLAVPRIYFAVNETGAVSFGAGESVEVSGDTATIRLYKDTESLKGTAVLQTVKAAADGTASAEPIKDAVFVVKDSKGAIVRDTSGNPYYIHYAGSPVVLSGLAAGSYILSQLRTEAGYVIAADQGFEVKADQKTEITVKNVPSQAGGAKKLEVYAEASYGGVRLTADQKVGTDYYLAMFADAAGTKRVSAVTPVIFTPDQQKSGALVFTHYDKVSGNTSAQASYYVLAVNEYGETVQDAQGAAAFGSLEVKATDTQAVFCYDYKEGFFPSGSFYYMADVEVTKQVKNEDDSDHPTTETFYAKLYEDEAQKIPTADFTFAMNGKSTVSVKASIKVTEAEAVYYLAETDQKGAVIDAESEEFPYAVRYLKPDYSETDQSVTIRCEQEGTTGTAKVTKAVIENRMKSSKVIVQVTDADGKAIEGVRLILKNTKGQRISVNNTSIYTSGKKDLVITGLTAGETYLLSEIEAPKGYLPAADVEFTVTAADTTTVTLKHKVMPSASNHNIKVEQHVYAGSHQVYAHKKATFYVALFSDESLTRKASDVQVITMSGLTGKTEFKHLKNGAVYYVARTDQYGIPLSKKNFTTQYSDGGRVEISGKEHKVTIRDTYKSLPSGYRYTALLTLTKRVEDASGQPMNTTATFYAGIFRKADFSDTPTIVPLTLKNTSSASSKRRILLSGNKDVTYYIAEVDKSGNLLTTSDQFQYEISVNAQTVQLTKSDSKTVTITNRQVSKDDSKVTLYLTKRVYEGTQQKAVNETFYAGLFKDSSFTKLYTKPIPLQLKDKSEVTLKLSLNLGKSKDATIYVAEVDKDGNVITAPKQQEFGYEVKMINSTASFTKDRREVQTVLLNSVYGTATPDDWDNIFDQNGNDFGGFGSGGFGGSGAISGNGEASSSTAAVGTGDGTPIGFFLVLLAVSAVLLGAGVIYFKKRRK